MRSCSLGIFGSPSVEEFDGFLHWPLALADVGDQVLALLKEMPAHNLPRLDALHDLKESGLARV